MAYDPTAETGIPTEPVGSLPRPDKLQVAYADYDSRGSLLGVELLGPCPVAVLDGIAANEPEPVRQFLRGGAPRELVPA